MTGDQKTHQKIDDEIDFTEMYVTHDAFRRDLERLEAAVAAGWAGAPRVREGWNTFTAQLLVHHSAEDVSLWPPLTQRLRDRPGALALLKEMEAEHALIDPLLRSFGEALDTGATDLTKRARELADGLGRHLAHEEEAALPLIQQVMMPADWRVFGRAMVRRQGLRGVAVWVPWVTDGMARDERRRFLARLPGPVRAVNRFVWEPRYRRRRLWTF